jgi:hypothetical protein
MWLWSQYNEDTTTATRGTRKDLDQSNAWERQYLSSFGITYTTRRIDNHRGSYRPIKVKMWWWVPVLLVIVILYHHHDVMGYVMEVPSCLVGGNALWHRRNNVNWIYMTNSDEEIVDDGEIRMPDNISSTAADMDDDDDDDMVLGEMYDTGQVLLQDLSWRVEKLRLEEQNIQRFLKARPRFLPYNECRKWVQAFNRWQTEDDWNEWIAMGEKRNAYIPVRVFGLFKKNNFTVIFYSNIL